jgi:Arc/MetJ family transcription regulator
MRDAACADSPCFDGCVYIQEQSVYTGRVSKHLVEIDDRTLKKARAELQTATIKETVNEALRRAGGSRGRRVERALDTLARAPLADRDEAWR